MTDRPVPAAGAVVWRSKGSTLQVLLVHRERYDDWTFPKGKLDPGETLAVAAAREVQEETGVRIRLGPRLAGQEYVTARPPGTLKQVTYWCARPIDDAAGRAADSYRPNAEITGVRWVDAAKAARRLTYTRDAAVLEDFDRAVAQEAHRTHPLVVLRHAAAEPRKTWRKDDRLRPLHADGRDQARQLVPLLEAYDPQQALSSDAVRCVQTVQPLVDAGGAKRKVRLVTTPGLSEEEATRSGVRAQLRTVLDGKDRAVLCTHRPVLPWVFEALDMEPVKLEPGQLLVLHRRHGRVLATEVLSP